MKNFINRVASFLCDCVDNMNARFIMNKIVGCLCWLTDRRSASSKNRMVYVILSCVVLIALSWFCWTQFSTVALHLEKIDTTFNNYVYKVTVTNNTLSDIDIFGTQFLLCIMVNDGYSMSKRFVRADFLAVDDLTANNYVLNGSPAQVKARSKRVLYIMYDDDGCYSMNDCAMGFYEEYKPHKYHYTYTTASILFRAYKDK